MKIGFLLGRVIVGVFYIYGGLHHFLDIAALTGYAKMKGVPFPGPAVAASGALLLIGGITLILGWYPRLGIAALVLFFIAVTPVMHNFWAAASDQRAAEQVHFLKNAALLGSALMLLIIREPWPLRLGPHRK
jgi:putative oxidoreductase